MSDAIKKIFEKNRNKKLDIKNYTKKLPKSNALPKEKKIIKKKDHTDQCFVIIPDIHSYERDKKAFELCMNSLPILNKMYNVTKVIQLGDLLEGGEISSHPIKNVFDSCPTYVDELEWCVEEFWKPVMKSCPNANYYALLGNHEDRINTWLAKQLGASVLSQSMFEQYSPKNLYESLGIHVTPYGNENPTEGLLEIFPNLVCVHGWSFAKNAAKAHLDINLGTASIIFGHTHRTQSDIRRNSNTNVSVGAWSFGALAKTNVSYQKGRPCDHTLGFGLVLTHNDSFQVYSININPHGKDSRKALLPNGMVIET